MRLARAIGLYASSGLAVTAVAPFAAASASASASASAGGATTVLVSVSSTEEQGNGISAIQIPAISADGRYVAFDSKASNLVPDDANGAMDVFVRDLLAGRTKRVSVSSSGDEGNARSTAPAISEDGRFVAFQSFATNLVDEDTNGRVDIFLHDLSSGRTTLASLSSDGEQGNGASAVPSVSSNGRLVAFVSGASDLFDGDVNGQDDVFLRDIVAGTTTLVSVSSDGNQGNDASFNPSISSDGGSVVFNSFASNLVDGDSPGTIDVFVRDVDASETALVSVSFAGGQAHGESFVINDAISAHGRFVAFRSSADNLVPDDENGHVVDAFVRDMVAGTTLLVSVSSSGEQGNAETCCSGGISANGRYVSFRSDATNLVSGDTNRAADVFVRDLLTGTTIRVSVSAAGEQGQTRRENHQATISGDGRFVPFASFASNLVPGDENGTQDVFVRGPLF
jgi:Tol biopolymer transport system component